jgi:hypothetical protein
MEPNIRFVKTYAYDDLLERIIDRGMVLDGMSHLAAIATSARLSAHTSRDKPERAAAPAGALWPPRALARQKLGRRSSRAR